MPNFLCGEIVIHNCQDKVDAETPLQPVGVSFKPESYRFAGKIFKPALV